MNTEMAIPGEFLKIALRLNCVKRGTTAVFSLVILPMYLPEGFVCFKVCNVGLYGNKWC